MKKCECCNKEVERVYVVKTNIGTTQLCSECVDVDDEVVNIVG